MIFPPELTLVHKAVIFGNHLAIELMAYTCFALLLSTEPVSRRYLRAKPMLDRISAAVLGALGVRLIVER